jgi:hypothetical protein
MEVLFCILFHSVGLLHALIQLVTKEFTGNTSQHAIEFMYADMLLHVIKENPN